MELVNMRFCGGWYADPEGIHTCGCDWHKAVDLNKVMEGKKYSFSRKEKTPIIFDEI